MRALNKKSFKSLRTLKETTKSDSFLPLPQKCTNRVSCRVTVGAGVSCSPWTFREVDKPSDHVPATEGNIAKQHFLFLMTSLQLQSSQASSSSGCGVDCRCTEDNILSVYLIKTGNSSGSRETWGTLSLSSMWVTSLVFVNGLTNRYHHQTSTLLIWRLVWRWCGVCCTSAN